MKSKLHQFVIVMKILRADCLFCFCFLLRLGLCVSTLVSIPRDLLSFVYEHSHVGFISFFCFVHVVKHWVWTYTMYITHCMHGDCL